jgi:hypothetical protein
VIVGCTTVAADNTTQRANQAGCWVQQIVSMYLLQLESNSALLNVKTTQTNVPNEYRGWKINSVSLAQKTRVSAQR